MCRKFLLISFIFSLLFFVGCEKVDFNETEGEPETDLPEEELSDTLSVAQALYLAEYGSDEDLSAINAVGIIGYIVGAIPGTSLSNAVFGPPYNSNSNILIADDISETQPERCMPVRLVKDTPFRAELNLEDNPANKGRLILVSGTIKSYFRTYGVYDLQDYAWCDGEQEDTKPDYDNGDNPYLDFDSELVQGGRQVHIRYCLHE